MPEQCPLKDPDRTDFDKLGIVWDAGVADECIRCYHYALEAGKVELLEDVLLPVPDWVHEDDFSNFSDGYVETGYKPVALNVIERHVETGTETPSSALRYPTNITIERFECSN